VKYDGTTPIEDTWPYKSLPEGWFQVGWVAEFEPCTVKPLHYFGLDLVLYRGEDGSFALLDAHCAHMGAHLGYGGKVSGCDIVCPFHGWQWGADGRNVRIPIEEAKVSPRRMRSWIVRETNGIVWTWYSPRAMAPKYDPPPEMTAGAGFLEPYPHCVHRWENVRARPQYMPENTVDVDHLFWVHHNRSQPKIVDMRDKGSTFEVDLHSTAGYGRERTWATPDGPRETVITTRIYGMGAITVDWGAGGDQSLLLNTQTPIDDTHLDMFVTVLVKQDAGDGPMPVGATKKRIEEQIRQADRDIPIWANMVYLNKPAYTRDEGRPMSTFRRWCAQFYPDVDD
jgi:3-ketosteroid 9alpha-monooxygenase subunit A